MALKAKVIGEVVCFASWNAVRQALEQFVQVLEFLVIVGDAGTRHGERRRMGGTAVSVTQTFKSLSSTACGAPDRFDPCHASSVKFDVLESSLNVWGIYPVTPPSSGDSCAITFYPNSRGTDHRNVWVTETGGTEELTDPILSEKYDDRIAQTLKSCALVARSFVRSSQTRLFARISVHDYEANYAEEQGLLPYSPHSASTILSDKLFALLSSSPHIAAYIQVLDLFYHETELVPPVILAAVTELRVLTLADHFCGYFPVNPSTLAVATYSFHDPWELESLLSTATSLRELTLNAVEFSDCDSDDEDDEFAAGKKLAQTGTGDGAVVLETLTLIRMEAFAVRPIVNLFDRVDVKHLASLSLLESPIMGFLKANARSIETITIGKAFPTSDSFYSVSAIGSQTCQSLL
ncbi:hypothetical protein C8R47DRAFT_1062454 [Mycena vitilis]|nr:hypothetical protein C8R47DRAFT_1062454 [Mycena vitilis]